MTSYRILHCADLHLDSPLRGLEADPDAPAARIRGATRQAFSDLVDYALQNDVAVVLIAGDLYDGDWQDWRTGQFLVRELERLTRAGVRVVAISGNHDAESEITRRLAWPEGATLLPAAKADTVTFSDLALKVHGRSFPQREMKDNLVPSYPAPEPGYLNIGLLHTAATGRPGHANYAPCTLEQLKGREYDYWALGHIHIREILCEDPWIVFPGNLQGRHARETGPMGATLISVADRRITGVEPVVFDVVRWEELNVDLSGAEDEDAAHQRIGQRLRDAVDAAEGRLLAARLRITGATPAHAALIRSPAETRARIRAEAGAAFPGALWLEQIVIETSPVGAPEPANPMVQLLLDRIRDMGVESLGDAVQPYAQAMLERAAELATRLEEKDPVRDAAAGTIAPSLIEEARALLLARLGG